MKPARPGIWRRILRILQLVVPLALIGWMIHLLVQEHPNTIEQLREQPKNWWMLALSTVVVFTGISFSFLRWYVLVAALRLPFQVKDAFRLGFIGYFMNFLSAGGVGGDVFKAAFMVREQKTRRSAALATIALDRFVGLYSLLLLTSLVAQGAASGTPLEGYVRMLPWLAVVATIGFVVGLRVMGTDNRFSLWVRQFPFMKGAMHDLVNAARVYRKRKAAVATAVLMSLGLHLFIAGGHVLIAHGLFGNQGPTVREHLVMTPLSHVVAAIPITPGGLGTYEVTLSYLYDEYPKNHAGEGRGLIVALCYRLQTLLIAAVGMFYCFAARTNPALHEVQAEEEVVGCSN